MKVAIPLFNNRVSPRFEFAPTLLLATIESNTILEKREVDLSSYDSLQRTALLRELGIDTLICGGIQGFLLRSLSWTQIQVVSSISGDAGEVLERFLQGNLHPPFSPFRPARGCGRLCSGDRGMFSPGKGRKLR